MFTHASRRRGVIASAIFGLVAAPLVVIATSAPAQAAPSTGLVISEVFGSGGFNGAPYSNDFVELYNPTGTAISVAGWSVQYRSSTGTAAQLTNLTGSVPAGGHYLIQGSFGSSEFDKPLPTPDAVGTLAMSPSNGVVILASNQVAVTKVGDLAGTGKPANVVDAVGYGTLPTTFETSNMGVAPNSKTSAQRDAAGTDTDANAADFSVLTPTPQNTAAPASLTVAGPGNKQATVGTAITGFTLAAGGGTAPYTWTVTGLPAGVTVSTNGAVSGTPTVAGTYEVTAKATDSAAPTAATVTAKFTITVNAAPVDVQILATNDFHGRLSNDTTTGAAGAAVLAGAVKQLRTTNPNTVFAAAGDLIGASTFDSFIAKDKPTIDALNEADLEVSAAGNHEFDQGYDDLVNRVMKPYNEDTNPYGGASWKYLGANVKFKADNSGALDGTWIKEMDGVKVGFVGAVTERLPELVTPGGIADILVTDTATAANAAADDLKDAGADVVVLLVHEGASGTDCSTINTDTTSDFGKITSAVNDNVDAIVSGHTHRAYNCSQTVPGWSSRSVTTRPIVSAGQYGANLNQINFTVDPTTGVVQAKTQAVLPLKSGTTGSRFNYPVDSATQTIVDTAVNNANVLGVQPLSKIGGPFTRAKLANGITENRGGESTLGNLVAETHRWATSDDAFGAAQIAFTNPGGLRADILGQSTVAYPRVVTYKEVGNVQPFALSLVNQDLTGAQIKSALEQQWQPVGASRPFLKLGISKGFTYTYDPTAAQGSRVKAMYLNGTAIALDATYSVTTNSSLSAGGDNFTALNGAAPKQDTGRTDLRAQVDYFAARDADDDAVPVDYSQRGVGASIPGGAPASYPSGGTVVINLSSLSMSAPGDLTDTVVTATINGTDVGSFPVTTIVQSGGAGYDEAGTATVAIALPGNLPAGNHQLLITGNKTDTQVKIPLTVDAPLSVATTVSGTADPIVYGADGTVAVTVTPSSATGTVQLLDGETVVGTGTLADGTTSITVDGTDLGVGSHDLTLKYLGDDGFDPSSGTVTVKVVKASTAVAGTSDPITYGQPGDVAVTVTSPRGTPSGEVELRDGSTVVGTGTLASGAGTITVPADALAVGEHTLTLAYLGATSFEPSTDTVKVAIVPIATTVSGTADPIVYGTDGAVAVTLTPSTATGTVQLLDGDTVVGTGTLIAGTASITVDGTGFAVGTHDLTLRYLGDTGYDADNGTMTVAVTKATSSVAVTAGPSPVKVKTSNKVSVRVRANGFTPSGRVQILSGSTVVGQGTLTAGNVAMNVRPYASVGTSRLTVNYLGDATTKTGSGSVSVRVVKQTPTMKVTAPKKVKKKAAPTVKVVLTGVGAKVSGKVTVTYKGKKVTKNVKNGKVTLKLARLTKTTKVKVKFVGNGTFNAVTKSVKITVKK